jgi:hypothetical protein
VARLPQQKRALGFEVRHPMGATEFIAADAEMQRVWFDAISATCDGWAAGVGDIPPRMPSRSPSNGPEAGGGPAVASTLFLGARLAPSLSRCSGFKACVACKDAMLQALEQARFSPRFPTHGHPAVPRHDCPAIPAAIARPVRSPARHSCVPSRR